MKISYSWLKNFIKLDWEAEKTGELLTDLGLEVEGIETVETIKGSLKGLVVGEVISCEQHPNADRLRVTSVAIGEESPLKIVCGAPNVAVGQKVAVATVGTTLYDAKGKEFKIKKGKIRGEESFGMLCAEDELGLGASHDGIMVLDADIAVGTPLAKVFNVEAEEVFEIGLTPNRADAMSHMGVARDLRAGLKQMGIDSQVVTPSVSNFRIDARTLKVDIEVENNKIVPRYAGVTITDVKVKESPEWLKNRLKSIGINPTNNIVDITNFVLHEIGQPLHAFDVSKIEGNKIKVKTLDAGTKFTTLDGVERSLHEEDIMICDANDNPLCIAGVLGGLSSGVTDNTKNVFLESAYFNSVSVRKTAKRHSLNTDASFRFERGIDPTITEYALKRAALLIMELADGKISSDIMEVYPSKLENFQVFLSYEKMDRLIGEKISRDTIKNILASLEIKINSVTEGGLGLVIPSYRVDVTREADIIEEILRVYGYNNIATSDKMNTSISHSSFDEYKVENTIANQLISQGFNEIMSNSLTKESYIEKVDNLNASANVSILNPLSKDLAVMRQSLLFSGLESIAYNLNRKHSDIKFFEFGKTYHKYSKYEEVKHMALFISGNREEGNWHSANVATDFFYGKSIVVSIFDRLGIKNYKPFPTQDHIYSEGISYKLGKNNLVSLGIVKKSIAKACGVKQEVFYADFNWSAIIQLISKKNIRVSDMPKYPAVKRDLSLLIKESVSFNEMYQVAFQTEKNLLKNVDLFDVYQGDKLPEGMKSYAMSFILQDEKKTLNDKYIDKVMQKLQNVYETKLGATLR